MELPAVDAAHKGHGGGRRRCSCRIEQCQPKVARPGRRGRHGGDRPGVGGPARSPVHRGPPKQPADRPEPVAKAFGSAKDARDSGHSHPAMALVTMHVGKSVTKCSTGSSPLRMVPCPGRERTWSAPPSAASRSAIPCRPVPYRVVAVSNPIPLSVTVKRRLSSEQERPTFARDALAYFVMFCSASRVQKYTAASVSCGYRPMPSVSISTCKEALRAWACSAGTKPWSASSGG